MDSNHSGHDPLRGLAVGGGAGPNLFVPDSAWTMVWKRAQTWRWEFSTCFSRRVQRRSCFAVIPMHGGVEPGVLDGVHELTDEGQAEWAHQSRAEQVAPAAALRHACAPLVAAASESILLDGA